MKVWNGIERRPDAGPPVVATVGNYDGLHLGHRAILHSVRAAAHRLQTSSLVITFDPHPLSVVDPSRAPRRLQTRRQKLQAVEAAGIDAVWVLTFDSALAALDGTEFFSERIGSRVPLAELHVGENFRFGYRRTGDLDLLRRLGAERGFRVIGVPPLQVDGQTVSSSAIRAHVETGDVEKARRMLGRPFALSGEVVRGAGRGRTLDFPTANLAVENEILPRRGVYVTETVARALRIPSVTNLGMRPTFDGSSLVVETNLIDFDDDLYGERLEVLFLARIRDEMRFPSPADLADQIARDRAAAMAFFQNAQPASR